MGLFELDDIFGFQDANDIKTFWPAGSDPDPQVVDLDDGEIYLNTSSAPYQLRRYNSSGIKWETVGGVPDGTQDPAAATSTAGDLFLNTTGSPPKLKYFNGTAWVTVSEMADSDILTAIKNVDGSGSGLDADKVDGIEGASFIRSDTSDTFTGVLTSTITSGAVIKFDGGHSMITVHDSYGNLNIKSGVDETHTTTVNDGGSHIEMDHSGVITLAVTTQTMGSTFTDDVYVMIHKTNGITLSGNTYAQTQMIIPLSQPASLTNGSIWIA
ncbi:MAG: hypothetical protein GY950_04200 [bacterium]|nr:hypothetical protein [bacterium]